ncbi:MAG: formate dehydrogenase [Alphaproteobacteria bacterium]|nr:formate dehydrogenase [Alphaproteobacteria bacterium]
MTDPTIDLSPPVADAVRYTTCYMCACRCGIRVHLRNGALRYIDGNPDHPVNRGVLCAKGSAGIMKQLSPAKLRAPLIRVGERGSGSFREASWDEALALASGWLGAIRDSDPARLAFFTGRDQSQALTGWWAAEFGTPNYAAHGGFCSVNIAAAGLYTIGGSFWEFGEPDWERTRYLVLFGVAEDHASNPIKIGLGALKGRGAKVVSINPVRTGYSAIADEWIAIRPGTDGLLVSALIRELLLADRVDFTYLVRYTNAPWLVIEAPGAADHGLFARGADGAPLCWDTSGRAVSARESGIQPALVGRFTLPDGRCSSPVFELLARRFLDPGYAAEVVSGTTGVPAATIRRLATELAAAAFDEKLVLEVPWTDWAGRRHSHMIGRPVSMHAMRGIAAHANGFHTCRAIHVLQILLGTIDAPGGFRFKPPYPRPIPPPPCPAGRHGTVAPGRPLAGIPLGQPQGPEDLLVDPDGRPLRIDKAFSWEAPLAAHGLLHTVIRNAWAGDPYPIDTLFLFMANMSWNSSMNVAETVRMLTDKDPVRGAYRIPHIIYADAFYSEMVPYADLVLADTTYLERHDCISLLDRPISSPDAPADAIRQPVLAPDRDVRPFQDVLLELGARLKLPGMVEADGAPRYPGGYADYMTRHERKAGVGLLAGWRGPGGGQHGVGAPNPGQLERYAANGCFWEAPLPEHLRFYKHANRGYLDYAARMGFVESAEPVLLQLYSEPLQRFRLAAEGHGPVQPPPALRERVRAAFDPLPVCPPPEADDPYPLHAVTQRPMAMYHSWDSQNAWQRQIHARNRLYMHGAAAAAQGLADGDWVWVISGHGRIRVQLQTMDGVQRDTVWTWNAIGKRAGAWGLTPDAPEVRQGFLLNHLIDDLLPANPGAERATNSDPVTGQAAWYDLRVRIERAADGEHETAPQFPPLAPPPGAPERPAALRYGAEFRARRGA